MTPLETAIASIWDFLKSCWNFVMSFWDSVKSSWNFVKSTFVNVVELPMKSMKEEDYIDIVFFVVPSCIPMILFLIVLWASPTLSHATLLKVQPSSSSTSNGPSHWVSAWRVCSRQSNFEPIVCRRCRSQIPVIEPPGALGLAVLGGTLPGLVFFPIFVYTMRIALRYFDNTRCAGQDPPLPVPYNRPLKKWCVWSTLCVGGVVPALFWAHTYMWFSQAAHNYKATNHPEFEVTIGIWGFSLIWAALAVFLLLWFLFSLQFLDEIYRYKRWYYNANQGPRKTLPFVKDRDRPPAAQNPQTFPSGPQTFPQDPQTFPQDPQTFPQSSAFIQTVEDGEESILDPDQEQPEPSGDQGLQVVLRRDPDRDSELSKLSILQPPDYSSAPR